MLENAGKLTQKIL